MDLTKLKEEFINFFGGGAESVSGFFAPGRVNLIGEHTDYNGGFVLPCSLQYGTYLLARKTENPVLKFRSLNINKSAEVDLQKEITKIGNEWMNYPLGIVLEFQKKGFKIPGLELLYSGNIPNGAGLSSSASIELVTAFALDYFLGSNQKKMELIKLSQHAENEFVGMKCGIMDQFAVAMGEKDHAVFLNCDTLDYEKVPLVLGDYFLMITNTDKRRELADSKYNERRGECEQAVAALNIELNLKNLSGLNYDEFLNYEHLIVNPLIRKRAKHVISENQRVIEAVSALKKGDLQKLGQLMYASHESLKNDYEVSCRELDVLVAEASAIDGVLGSRMTGAGFGGCTVSLVHKNSAEKFKAEISKNYTRSTGLIPEFYEAETGNGIMKVF